MDNKNLRLRVITPTGKVLDTQTESLRLPAADGSLGIRKGHTAALILLKAGDIAYTTEGVTKVYPLKREAFAKVKDDLVTIITG